LHGPSSVMYGAGSPGGIVNMISKRPTAEPFHEFVTQAGNYGLMMGGADVGGPIDADGKLLYRLTALGRQNGTQIDFTEYQRRSIAPALTWRPSSDTTWTILANYQYEPEAGSFSLSPARGTVLFNPNGTVPTHFYSGEPGFDRFRREQFYTTSLFEHRFNDVFTVRQNARYLKVNADAAIVLPVGLQPTNLAVLNRAVATDLEDVATLTADTQAEAKFLTGPFSHTLLVGNDIQRAVDTAINRQGVGPVLNAFNPVYGLPVRTPPITVNRRQALNQVGYYAEDQVRFGNLFGLFGVRRDHASANTDNLLSQTQTG
jgi:iron complex outermembrane recepter protein